MHTFRHFLGDPLGEITFFIPPPDIYDLPMRLLPFKFFKFKRPSVIFALTKNHVLHRSSSIINHDRHFRCSQECQMSMNIFHVSPRKILKLRALAM